MKKIKVGLMGFGEIPRHIYRLCLENDLIEIVAIADIGRPEILHYLLEVESKLDVEVKLEGNFLVSKNGKARIVTGRKPGDVPWDIFDVDFVVEATAKYKRNADLQEHLKSGAKRVVLPYLPENEIDRIVIVGVNDHTIKHTDKLISAGSATTNATGILLKVLNESFGVDYAMLTTVHSYTSDQPLRDRVGADFRRSRSAAENIIPNNTPSPEWLQKIMPEFKDRIEGSALNVPVPNGSLLDLTAVLKRDDVSIDELNEVVKNAAKKMKNVLEVVDDPIVSTDVIGNTHSVVFDKMASMKSPGRMIKVLAWYHTSLNMAARVIDVILAYHNLSAKGGLQ